MTDLDDYAGSCEDGFRQDGTRMVTADHARDDSGDIGALFPLTDASLRAAYEQQVERDAEALSDMLPPDFSPEILVVLGTNLGEIAEDRDDWLVIPYSQIPHLCGSTATGHRGNLLVGRSHGHDVLCMQGRLHGYEGLTPLQVTYPVRLAHAVGARTAILTNATGGINLEYHPGQVVAISDHINLTGTSPLIGANADEAGPRFPDMSGVWSASLRALAQDVATELSLELHEGVYLGLNGPSFETPAEIRAFRAWGADLVGMSTIWEAIIAAWLGMDLLGLSMVTNMAAGVTDAPITLDEIQRSSQAGRRDMSALIRGMLARL